MNSTFLCNLMPVGTKKANQNRTHQTKKRPDERKQVNNSRCTAVPVLKGNGTTQRNVKVPPVIACTAGETAVSVVVDRPDDRRACNVMCD